MPKIVTDMADILVPNGQWIFFRHLPMWNINSTA